MFNIDSFSFYTISQIFYKIFIDKQYYTSYSMNIKQYYTPYNIIKTNNTY